MAKLVQLAYRFLVFGRDFKAVLVVKIKGRGRSGHFDGIQGIMVGAG
jgi:hypothetical protein